MSDSGSAATPRARGRFVMVCGSRSWRNDYRTVWARLTEFPVATTVILHGGASGVDTLAEDAANEIGLVTHVFLPDRSRPSPQRYHERNDAMLEQADLVLAWWDGESRGTKSVIAKALRLGIDLEVRFGSRAPRSGAS